MAQENTAPVPVKNAGEAPAPPKKSKLKLILLLALPLLLGLGGGLTAAKLLLKSQPPGPATGAADGSAAQEADGPGGPGEPPIIPPRKDEHGPAPGKAPAAHSGAGSGEETDRLPGLQVVELKPFVVNLSEPSGKRYLKVTMSLDAGNPALAAEISAKLPAIRDMILLLLSSQSIEDIRGMEGKTRLRGQITNRVNDMLTGGRIQNIYFSEFVVQ